MTVSVTITNSGKTAEVVVSLEKSIDKPKEELKAFGKPICCSLVKVKHTLEINAKDLASFVPTKRLDC
jgi:hypothetical protein